MNNLFFEKYSTKNPISKLVLKYSHISQTNKSVSLDYKMATTRTRVSGEANDFDKLLETLAITVLTKTSGEETDDDELMRHCGTQSTDNGGEETDEDLFYLAG